jgi:hypothetical protein
MDRRNFIRCLFGIAALPYLNVGASRSRLKPSAKKIGAIFVRGLVPGAQLAVVNTKTGKAYYNRKVPPNTYMAVIDGIPDGNAIEVRMRKLGLLPYSISVRPGDSIKIISVPDRMA